MDSHTKMKHQGAHITHGSIIEAGFHLEDGRKSIRNFVNSCVLCRKLRGKTAEQLMADFPVDRLEETAPFENVGLDAFGPFMVHDSTATRRTSANKKVWALIFVCLPSRAIHIEPLVGMDVSSFRNALSRFISLRGPVKTLRSHQGTNFVAAKSQLEQAINVGELSGFLDARNMEWIFNPPHASHQGGTWERKIGSVRRVLEALLRLSSNRGLSRDEFCTLLADAANVVNSTPLWVTSSDPNDPNPLTPNMYDIFIVSSTKRVFEQLIALDESPHTAVHSVDVSFSSLLSSLVFVLESFCFDGSLCIKVWCLPPHVEHFVSEEQFAALCLPITHTKHNLCSKTNFLRSVNGSFLKAVQLISE